MKLEELAYRLGFGARRRAELAEYYRQRSEREWLWRPPPPPRRRRRGRVWVHGHVGCLGCSAPLLVALAVVGALVAWMG